MTNILMLTLVYGPDTVSTANMMTDIANGLSDNGHSVTVLTSVPHYNPAKEVLDNPVMRSNWRKPFTESIENGVRVLRVFMPPKRHKIWARVFDYIIFQALTTILGVFRVARPDVVFVTSPPITLGLSGILISWIKGGRFVYDVRELWPDVPVRMGLFRNLLLIKLVYWLEDFVYRKTVAISTIARSFQNTLVERGVPRKKLYFTPNFVDVGFIRPSESQNEFSSANRLDGMFVVLYAGNVGLTQGLEILLEVANAFTVNDIVQFVVVGDGAARSRLETALTKSNLKNLRMLPFQPVRLVNSMYAAADVCIVPLRRGFSYDTVPSKIYTAMAAGRPVLASAETDSETALLLNESSAGVCVEPESAEALIEAITSLYDNPAYVSDMGDNGRKWIENYYSRSVVIDAYDNMLREVSG